MVPRIQSESVLSKAIDLMLDQSNSRTAAEEMNSSNDASSSPLKCIVIVTIVYFLIVSGWASGSGGFLSI